MQPLIDLPTAPRSSIPASSVDEAGELLGEPHPVAVDRAGAGQGLGDFEELLGGEHRADGGPADEQADVVQPAEGRRLAQPERRRPSR